MWHKLEEEFTSFGQPTGLITCANHGNDVQQVTKLRRWGVFLDSMTDLTGTFRVCFYCFGLSKVYINAGLLQLQFPVPQMQHAKCPIGNARQPAMMASKLVYSSMTGLKETLSMAKLYFKN